MDIDSDHLRESKIGHVVYFLHMTEKESDKMRKKWGDLISKALPCIMVTATYLCRYLGKASYQQKCKLPRYASGTDRSQIIVSMQLMDAIS